MLVLSALASGASAYGSSRSASAANKRNAQINEEQLGLDESKLNPFRAVLDQQYAMEALDRGQNTTPRTIGQDQYGYAKPQGGQYTMSPELAQFLATLKQRIASGQAANPAVTTGYRNAQPNLNLNAGPNAPRQAPMQPDIAQAAHVGMRANGRHPVFDPATGMWT